VIGTSATGTVTPARRVDDIVDRRVAAIRSALGRAAGRVPPRVAAAVALLVVLLVSAAVILANVRGQWFVYDEFDYLAPPEGRSWVAWVITPHNEHTILFTKIWFSTLFSTIGLNGYWVYALPMVLSHLAGGVAVYRLMRLVIASRAIAVAVVAPILLMPAGVGTLTWAGQFQYTAASAAGLWLLVVALSPGLSGRSRWIWAIALSLVGTFSGSAFIPLGVAAGFALLSLRRYLLGAIVGLIPAAWFVLVRVFWEVPSQNSAKSIGQILADGPEFVYALLARAIDDSLPLTASVAPAVVVVGALGVVAFLAVRPSTVERPRARRTFLFLLLALVLSLVITLVGRLSRNLAESASGGYSYFILIAAIPLVVMVVGWVGSRTRIASAAIVVLLLGWAAVGSSALTSASASFAAWKSTNVALVTGAASLAEDGYPVASDAAPSPALAPFLTWSDVEALRAAGKIDAVAPSTPVADQLSLNVQWTAGEPESPAPSSCAIIPPHGTGTVPADTPAVLTSVSDAASTATLSYPSSASSRAIPVTPTGTQLDSVSKRAATLTAGDEAVSLCR
jgi:hypothetical protein